MGTDMCQPIALLPVATAGPWLSRCWQLMPSGVSALPTLCGGSRLPRGPGPSTSSLLQGGGPIPAWPDSLASPQSHLTPWCWDWFLPWDLSSSCSSQPGRKERQGLLSPTHPSSRLGKLPQGKGNSRSTWGWSFPPSPSSRPLPADCGALAHTGWPLLLSAPVPRGTQALTYEGVQGRGVIQELLRQIPRANGSRAASAYWPKEVLLHEHRGQRHSLQTAGCKAAGEEPVHQGGACGGQGQYPSRQQAPASSGVPGCDLIDLDPWGSLEQPWGSALEQIKRHPRCPELWPHPHLWPARWLPGSSGLNTTWVPGHQAPGLGAWPGPRSGVGVGGSPMKVFL